VSYVSSPSSQAGTRGQPDANARANRIAAIVIGLLAVVLGVLMGVVNPLLNYSTAAEGVQVDTLFGVLLGIATTVFVVVQGSLLYSIWRFRRRSDDDEEDGPPVRGNVPLEIIWTAIPAATVTGLALFSYLVLAGIELPRPDALRVDVTARQFVWDFYYADRDVHSPELHVPVGRQVHLVMRSADVIHAFWVPNFRVKKDLMPDRITEARFTADKIGTYPIVCSRLCGVGHAFMRSNVIVQDPNDFNNWLYQQQTGRAAQATGGAAADGKQVFLKYGCNACHTLTDAGAAGQVGPSLNGIGAKAADAVKQPHYHGKAKDAVGFINESIVEPNAYVEPGYQPNVMPQDFGKQMSDQELNALVQYLAEQK
jgi:cytochrome c oxidase subunit II